MAVSTRPAPPAEYPPPLRGPAGPRPARRPRPAPLLPESGVGKELNASEAPGSEARHVTTHTQRGASYLCPRRTITSS